MDAVETSWASPGRVSPRLEAAAFITTAIAAYALLALPLRDWIVDDAAISMAYARNWSEGHGLVAQPGAGAIEGYSNFLWVVLLGLLNLVGAMTTPVIKLGSAALVGLSLISLNRTCRLLIPGQSATQFAVLLFVATNSAIVTWTTSGLENPLTLLLSCELLRVVSEASLKSMTVQRVARAGLLVGAMALNRPDGVAFAAFPLLVLVTNDRRRLLGLYGLVVAGIYACFLTFRVSTFHDWLPNTFHAKEASAINLNALTFNAANILGGPFGTRLVLIGIFVAAYLKVRSDGAFAKRLLPPLAMMAVAGGVFILMPPDWMPDRRFGTPFIPAVFLFVGVALSAIVDQFRRGAALISLLVLALAFSSFRLTGMYREPVVPASWVEQNSAKFNERARMLGVRHGSLLIADLGSVLLTSDLRIYDLAGLTDRVIGRALPNDRPRFYRYVFDDARPTFIKTNGPWAERAAFDEVARFRKDYVAIHEEVDAELLKRGIIRMSGEYVRRDALQASGDPNTLRRLR